MIYTVTFNEPVTGVNTTAFSVPLTGTVSDTGITVTPVSGSVYTVTINGISGTGSLGLNLVDTGAIHDLAGAAMAPTTGSFAAQASYAVGANPVGVVTSDLNGDGGADLIVANRNSNTVSVLLGNGNGTFRAQTTWAVGRSPRSVTVADLNGDGIPDIASLTNYAGSGGVSVLLGNGNGTFKAQMTFADGNAVSLNCGGRCERRRYHRPYN